MRLLHARVPACSPRASWRERPDAGEDEIREALGGNLCRCTGYQTIVDAVTEVAARRRDPAAATGAHDAPVPEPTPKETVR